MNNLIYPGNRAEFGVEPKISSVDPDTLTLVVETWIPEHNEPPHFWSVYSRSNTGDVDNVWSWIADFLNENDAREYAAWRAKEN